MNLLACLAAALLALLMPAVYANTEKIIFLAPAAIAHPETPPNLRDLQLDVIAPFNSSLTASLPVAFPSAGRSQGLDSWYLVRGLSEGQRYEVRVCWTAIQPTKFWIDFYNITHAFDTPAIVQSLAAYAGKRRSSGALERTEKVHPSDAIGSALFLHVHAAADFFTTNKTLMQSPPSVDVDIILDPYIGNIFPQSLLPTAGYIVVLAVGSFFLSGWIWTFLQSSLPVKSHAD